MLKWITFLYRLDLLHLAFTIFVICDSWKIYETLKRENQSGYISVSLLPSDNSIDYTNIIVSIRYFPCNSRTRYFHVYNHRHRQCTVSAISFEISVKSQSESTVLKYPSCMNAKTWQDNTQYVTIVGIFAVSILRRVATALILSVRHYCRQYAQGMPVFPRFYETAWDSVNGKVNL